MGVEGAVFVAYYMGLCDDSSDELNSQAIVSVSVSVLQRGHASSPSGAGIQQISKTRYFLFLVDRLIPVARVANNRSCRWLGTRRFKCARPNIPRPSKTSGRSLTRY